MKIFFIIILLVIGLFTYIALPIFTPSIERRAQIAPFWEVEQYADHYRALGITLGKTSLSRAIEQFGNRFELAIYVDMASSSTISIHNAQLEVYFRETEVGQFTGRVVGTLSMTPQLLETLLASHPAKKRLPSALDRYKLSENAHHILADVTFETIAFIPNAIRLTPEIIESRFGQADQVITELSAEGKVEHYLYQQRGIDVAISTRGRSIIQFVKPQQFEQKVLMPLYKQKK